MSSAKKSNKLPHWQIGSTHKNKLKTVRSKRKHAFSTSNEQINNINNLQFQIYGKKQTLLIDVLDIYMTSTVHLSAYLQFIYL